MLTDEQIALAWLDFGPAVRGTRPTTPPYQFARAVERISVAAERERCAAEFVENGRAIEQAHGLTPDTAPLPRAEWAKDLPAGGV